VGKIRTVLLVLFLFVSGPLAFGDALNPIIHAKSELGKTFVYTATQLGIPILKAIIKIEGTSSEPRDSFLQVHAFFHSFPYVGLFFRMNNHFTSTVEADNCSPVRYVKEIDQEGILIKNKNYTQTIAFDNLHGKVVTEGREKKEREEIFIPPGTYDPLSMFARCYLKEELHPGQDIRMSIFDGVKVRQLIFHSRKEMVKSKIYGKVEAMRLESSTSFSTFGDQEGTIRIWYLTDGQKTPISMELDLPVGKVKFELESVDRS
jgi:hypothetical protein